MILRLTVIALSVALTAHLVRSQLPPPQQLSGEDNRAFNEELQRLQPLLATANDKAAIQLQIANTYAAGGQYAEAIRRLRKVVDADLGFDPSRDPDFVSFRKTIEFQSIMEKVRHQTPPVSNSRLVATIHERDFIPRKHCLRPKAQGVFSGQHSKK